MAMTRRVALIVVLSAVTVIVGFPAAALAETVVPRGVSVTEVTSIGQDVTLNGTSQGSVIIIDGDLTIGPHGRALHGITVIGGHISTAPGGEVRGDVLQAGGRIPSPGLWWIAAMLTALVLVRSLVVWILLRVSRILAGWSTTGMMLAGARTRPLRATLVGALLAAGLLAATILLTLTVVGVVFAAALVGAVLLAGALGVAFALSALHTPADTRTVMVALVCPLLGDALFAMAVVVGLGAVFHYLVDERRSQTNALPTSS
jgi:hypothetical protein